MEIDLEASNICAGSGSQRNCRRLGQRTCATQLPRNALKCWVAFDAHASLAHLDLTPAYNGTCLVDRAAYFRSQLPNTRFTSPATSSRHAARLWPVANNAS